MIKNVGFSLVSAILVAGILLVAHQVLGLDDVGPFKPGFLIAAVTTHFMTLTLIALRLKLSLSSEGPQSFVAFLDLTVLHNFLLAFLPARLGDAYYPFLVAARSRGSVGAGVGNLILLRLLDISAIGVLATVALPWVVMDGIEIEALIGLLALALIAALGLILMLAPILAGIQATCRRVARCTSLTGKLFRLLNQARRWVRAQSPSRRLILYGSSLALWSSSAMTYFVIFRGLGLHLDLPRSMLAGQLTELGAILPVQTVAGLGAGEGVMTAVLAGYGLAVSKAAVIAVWSRLTILGAIGTLFASRAFILIFHYRNNRINSVDSMTLQALLFGRIGGFTGDDPVANADGGSTTGNPSS